MAVATIFHIDRFTALSTIYTLQFQLNNSRTNKLIRAVVDRTRGGELIKHGRNGEYRNEPFTRAFNYAVTGGTDHHSSGHSDWALVIETGHWLPLRWTRSPVFVSAHYKASCVNRTNNYSLTKQTWHLWGPAEYHQLFHSHLVLSSCRDSKLVVGYNVHSSDTNYAFSPISVRLPADKLAFSRQDHRQVTQDHTNNLCASDFGHLRI